MSQQHELSGLALFEAVYAPAEMECSLEGCGSKGIKEGDLFLAKLDTCAGGNLKKSQGKKLSSKKGDKECSGSYHMECFFKSIKSGCLKDSIDSLKSINDIKGFESLNSEDQDAIREHIGHLHSEKSGGEHCLKKDCAKDCKEGCDGKECCDKLKEGVDGKKASMKKASQKKIGSEGVDHPEKELHHGHAHEPDENGKRKISGGEGKDRVASPTHKKLKEAGEPVLEV